MSYNCSLTCEQELIKEKGGTAAWEQVGPGKDTKPESFKLPTPKPEPPKEEAPKK